MIESEQIVKGYDPVIMRRLLGYLRPYRATVAIAVVALLFATAGELLLPVIIQQTLDRYILSAHRRVPEATVADAAQLGLEFSPRDPVIGEYRYVPDERLSAVAGADMNRLRERGLVSSGEYLLVRLDADDGEQAAVLRNHPGLFASGDIWAAISRSDLPALGPAELRVLRKDDIAGVYRAALFFLLSLLGVLLFSFLQVYLMAKAGQEVMQDIRVRLFDHTIRQSLSFLNRNPVGKLVSRVTNDVETINELFTSVVTSILKDGSLMIGVIVTLFLLSVPLGFVALLTPAARRDPDPDFPAPGARGVPPGPALGFPGERIPLGAPFRRRGGADVRPGGTQPPGFPRTEQGTDASEPGRDVRIRDLPADDRPALLDLHRSGGLLRSRLLSARNRFSGRAHRLSGPDPPILPAGDGHRREIHDTPVGHGGRGAGIRTARRGGTDPRPGRTGSCPIRCGERSSSTG